MALYSTLQKFITKEGAPVEGASVNVKISGGAVDAELFATRTGAAKNNPFLTTANGEALCYVKAGRYDMTVTKGTDQIVFKDVEVGPVSNVGTFAGGGTITDPDQLVEDLDGNKWRWTGNLNYTFSEGENPESNPGWVKYIGGKYASIIALLEQWGYNYKGTFSKGFTYSQEKDAGIDKNGKVWIYAGSGAPNKVVAAGTVPSAGSGYEKVTFNAASSVTDTVSGNLQTTLDQIMSVNGANPVMSLVNLVSVTDNERVHQVSSFYPNRELGGGEFVLFNGYDMTKHDGCTVIAKDSIVEWVNQAALLGPITTESLHATIRHLFSGNVGVGDCFVRINYNSTNLDMRNFGAIGDGVFNDSNSFEAYNNTSLPSLNGRYGDTYLLNKGFRIKSNKLYHGRFSKIIWGDPDASAYHALITGEDSGDGKHNFEISGWEFESVYTESGEGEFRRCIWVGDDSSDFKIHSNSFKGFYWNVFVASKDNGPASTNPDSTYRFPRNFKIYSNKMRDTLGNAIFLVKGPSDFEIYDNDIRDVGLGRLKLGHAILVDFVSASEGSGDNGIKSTNGRIYKNTIRKTRQGGITVSGCDDIHTYENSTSDIGFHTGANGAYPINYGYKYDSVPVGCSISRNKIGASVDMAIEVSGGVDVIGNTIEDACIVSGASYIRLGNSISPWIESECSGNKIIRESGRNVPALTVSGGGSTENCIIGPNIYKGHSKVASRYLELINSASIKSSCVIVSQVKSGVSLFDGDSSRTTFSIPHGLDVLDNTKISASVSAASQDASSHFYTSISGGNIVITFQAAPPSGSGNVRLAWQALDPLYSV